MIWQYGISELYREFRHRILAETERFLAKCLADPKLGVRIPRIRVGSGEFPPGFAEQFWADVLGEDRTG